MLETVVRAPPDPILGLVETFNKDPRPGKVNLTAGVYKAEDGTTPVLQAVQEAERRRLETEVHKTYRPISGDPELTQRVVELVFGQRHPALTAERVAAAHTPGGTGALRVAADLLAKIRPQTKVWASTPTWANHPNIFQAAGLQLKAYRYYDPVTHSLDFEGMLESLRGAQPGDAVLLHACCHNPTGVDLSASQWQALAAYLKERTLFPVVDFAYQGFAAGLREDAQGLLTLVDADLELLVCSSFSKNFGLYCERAGALSVLGSTKETAQSVLSQMKAVIRCNYSNPPAHGGSLVRTILSDAELRTVWEGELAKMRTRIQDMRAAFVTAMADREVDMGFVGKQNGMFSFSGLNKTQVEALRERHGVYIVGSGRMNVAGLNRNNLDIVCDAVAAVMKTEP